MDQSLIWYKMKAMFKICNIHLKNVSVVTSVYWPYSRFVSDTNKHLNPTILAKWPRAYMQNFTARNIIFESLALLNFIFRNTHTHKMHQHVHRLSSKNARAVTLRSYGWYVARQNTSLACLCFIGFVREFTISLYNSAHREYVCGNKVQNRISGSKRYFCSYGI